MSTLGKVLLFVNILLAFGVLFLASQDYAKRRGLNEAALKYQIVLDGLPVDTIKTDGELDADSMYVSVAGPNQISTTTPVSKKLVESLFAGTDNEFGGPGAPKTQVDQLNSVYTKLSGELDGLPSDAARVNRLCGFLDKGTFRPGLLMDLADTFEERQAIRRLAAVPPDQMAASAKNARERLKRRFDAVLAAANAQQPEEARKVVEDLKAKIAANPNDAVAKQALNDLSAAGPTGPAANDLERRLKIAQLLMQLNRSPGWQKKVALLVGLKVYQLAITEQTSRLDAMATQTRDFRFADQISFDVEYEQLKSFALENSKLVDQQTRVVEGMAKTLATDQSLYDTRAGQLKSLKDELAQLSADVAKQLAAQKQVEQNLFAVQREVGQTLRETGKLENDLRAKEQK